MTPAPETATNKGTITVNIDLAKLPSHWSSLTLEVQTQLWRSVPIVRPLISSLEWMQAGWTKTRDDQDNEHPFKPFPKAPYFRVIHELWLQERVLYIEKSRSMITSWWAAAETLHYVMTHQPSKAILWVVDECRAVVLRDYCWVLWEQQRQQLKDIYPVLRPRKNQSYDKLEFAGGGTIIGLPGKDPDVMRSSHPSILVLD